MAQSTARTHSVSRRTLVCGLSVLVGCLPVWPQQQKTPATGILPDIAQTERTSYMTEIMREYQGSLTFRPNAFDLLIQQAEDKYRTGVREYTAGDFDRARADFDAAIGLMLRASDGPTNKSLFDHTLENMVDSIHRYDLTGLGAAQTTEDQGFDKAPLDELLDLTLPVNPGIKAKVEEQLKTTSSVLPLVLNDAVLTYVNYFSGKGHRTMENGLTRAGRYEPMITKIFTEEGIPPELIRLAQAESGFLPRAVSRAAAKGMWQFVKFRGNEYGLLQTQWTDDRLDPEKATRAAAHHLHDLFNEFHDWYLAMAAYNCGPGVIEKAVERTGYADYWELRARGVIPKETANYVPIILGMTIVGKNPKEYGLFEITPEKPVEYETLMLDAPTNLGLISDLTETPLPELQQLNPSLLRGTAPMGYELRVPKGATADVKAALDTIPEASRGTARLHKVESGETLAGIATHFKATPAAILTANHLTRSAEISPGDRLLIPSAYHEAQPKPVKVAAKAGAKSKKTATTVAKATPKALASRAPLTRSTSAKPKTLASAAHPATIVR